MSIEKYIVWKEERIEAVKGRIFSMNGLLLFIIIVVAINVCIQLYRLLTGNFNYYVSPKLKEPREEDIKSINHDFFNNARNLLAASGFEEREKYLFSMQKDSDGYLESFVNMNTGMLAVVMQMSPSIGLILKVR